MRYSKHGVARNRLFSISSPTSSSTQRFAEPLFRSVDRFRDPDTLIKYPPFPFLPSCITRGNLQLKGDTLEDTFR
jgi:hypothetical protein